MSIKTYRKYPYESIVNDINKLDYSCISIEQLKENAISLKKKAETANLDDLLTEAYALVKEAAYRTINLRPYDTQVMAGIAMHFGKLAEMQTGEGKTLAAVMPAYLNSLSGKTVHILTFNDYLAKRDYAWMKPVYECLGVSIGYINENMPLIERKQMYKKEIVYLSAKSAGFDYLRDFLCTDPNDLLHSELYYAIIDEADSILIDEARIPLVIAGEFPEEFNCMKEVMRCVKALSPSDDIEIDEQSNSIHLTEQAVEKVERTLGIDNLYSEDSIQTLYAVNCALQAQFLLAPNRDYVIKDNDIKIVDSFTGRIAHNRRYPYMLHNAVMTKENINSGSNSRIMNSITFQSFFNKYRKRAGMTGTVGASSREFWEIYDLDAVVIPTYKPCSRVDHADVVFAHKAAKQSALISEIIRANSKGQPVLIGTSSVEESEKLSEQLYSKGIKHNVLNAKNDQMEADIIARAGEPYSVTVSTNMAGRGVDIKLGGIDEKYKNVAANAGGLYVIGTNKHESIRIDNQLRGRAGRQGDAGESRFFVSLEDELMLKFKIKELFPEIRFTESQDKPITDKAVLKVVTKAQRIADGANYDLRRSLYKYTYILDQQREIITSMRQEVLKGIKKYNLLQTRAADHYNDLVRRVGTEAVELAEKQLLMYFINKNWAEYLEFMEYIREGIHFSIIAGKNPIDEYHSIAINSFDEMKNRVQDDVIETAVKVEIKETGIDMEKEGLGGAAITWTYLINENTDQFSRLPYLVKTISNRVQGTLFSLSGMLKKFLSKCIIRH